MPAGGPQGHCPRCLWRVSVATEEDFPDNEIEEPRLVLGDHEVHEEIARGGMGVVYRARHRGLDREVAVKVLRGGEWAGEEAQARFRSEAMAVARLRHPGIVAIHDVGEQDGVPWFSMDYVPGENLADAVREHPLPARAAADCVRRVAEAVQHAHEHGVLHRDLKPSNILLTSSGQPCVTDFGIARRLAADAAELTRTGQALGSPGYAAPEQAFGGTADPRTDVYGLGAVLYHVLTGRPPFQGPTPDSILLQLRDSDPVAPRRLNPTVPRDLETICLHCLRKDPARRYATAAEVAADLARFLAGEPIHARPLGPIGRTLRWCRRRKKVAALLAFCALLLVALVAGSLLFARRHAQLEHRAVLLGEVRAHRLAGLAGSRELALTALRQAWDIKPSAELRAEAVACLALPDIQLARTVPRSDPQARAPDPGGSADGRVALRFEKNTLIVFARSGDLEIARFDSFAARPIAQLDDTGGRLAIVQQNTAKQPSDVVLYALPSKHPLHRLDHPHTVRCLDWAGELIAVGGSSDRLIHIWDATSGRRLHRFNGHDAEIEAVRFRPHGQELVSCAQDSTLRVWHAGRGVELLRLEGLSEHTGPAWWAADGAQIFLPLRDRPAVDVFHCTWPESVQVLAPGADEPSSENLPSLTLHPTADLAAAVDETGCHVWSLRHGRVVAHFPKTGNEWMTARFGDAASLWLSGWNRALRRVPIEPSADGWPRFRPLQPSGANSGPLLVAARADGGAFALTNNKDVPAEDVVEVFLSDEKRTIMLPQVDPYCAALSPDGRWAVTGSFATSGAQVWTLPDGRAERRIEHPGVVLGTAFVENGATLWLWGDRGVQRVRAADWTRLGEIDTRLFPAFTVSPDGRFTAITSRTEVIVQRSPAFAEVLRLPVPAHAGRLGSATLVFSADSQHLALHTSVGSVVVWNLVSLREELRALGMDW
jgi:WD40 repeat protein/predicted Ser/Thr protein kinase